jgi:hypothetical protein
MPNIRQAAPSWIWRAACWRRCPRRRPPTFSAFQLERCVRGYRGAGRCFAVFWHGSKRSWLRRGPNSVAYIAPAHPPRDLVPRNVSRRRFELPASAPSASSTSIRHRVISFTLTAMQVGYMVQKETGTPARSSAALPTDLAPQTPNPAGKCSSRHSVARGPTVENAARPVGHITLNNTLLSRTAPFSIPPLSSRLRQLIVLLLHS